MAFTKYLDLETMHKLITGIRHSAPIATLDSVRNQLLIGIDPGFVAMLPVSNTPLVTIQSDLNEMNTVSHLMGNEVPLQLWLMNAVNRMRASRRPETSFFEKVLEDVTAQSQRVIAEASGVPGDPLALDQAERIIHKDNMLSFGWLAGALAVGSSVARLTVTRFENSQSTEIIYFGTGWLIGKQHLITNHHVINARSSGESAAAEADLILQAESTVVSFDYNDSNIQPNLATVEKLCAWRSFYNNPSLDYAILQLKEPISNRASLTLAPKKLKSIEQALQNDISDNPPVNIIQHPGGQPKMLGIRNNQIHQLTEYELSYFTDTEGGSSGSPVCDDEWHVIALHRRWQHLYQKNIVFQGKDTAWENRGVRIDRIIDDLQDHYRDLWGLIKAVVI